MKELAENAWHNKAENILKHVNCRLVLKVLQNNLENTACWNLATLDQIIHHVEDHLPVKTAFNLVKASLKCSKSHLIDAKLTISVSTIVDKEGSNFLLLWSTELLNCSLTRAVRSLNSDHVNDLHVLVE